MSKPGELSEAEGKTKLPEKSDPSIAERMYYIATRKYQGNTHIPKKDRLHEIQEVLAAELAAKDAEIARLREECDEYVASMTAERKPDETPILPLARAMTLVRIRRGKPIVHGGRVYDLPEDGPRSVAILVRDLQPIDKVSTID